MATTAMRPSAPWWTPPGETDTTAYAALILLFLLIFAVFHLYARFDRYAEHHNEGTPLQTTIPMLLMIAFAYEIFPPLSHFSILLPLALIATALARDLMLWFEPMKEHTLKGELEGVLLDDVWGIRADITTRTVDTHVKRLREKLESARDYVETVRGVGYRFVSSPNEAAS